MRVTNNVMMERAMRNVNGAFQRYVKRQEQLASGLSINRLSDDPHGAAKAVRLRSTLKGMEQYKKNAEAADTSLNTYDGILDKVGNVMNRLRDLVARAASDTVTSTERDAIAVEIRELFEEVVNAGNEMHNGEYMFAGHKVGTAPFEVVRDADGKATGVLFSGDSGKDAIEVGPGIVISRNLVGDEVFMADGANVFDTMIDIETHLLANDTESLSESDLASIDAVVDNILKHRSEIGGKGKRLELVIDRIERDSISIEGLLSKTEDIDFAEAIMRLYEQGTVYNAALAAASKSVQMGLLQFLR
ncbi:MAG: flagellar hook-associated protein FlgL [Firmicutes bacterium]|nr:flagellar hook-associated protein FlgL [Bacillota bacterium]